MQLATFDSDGRLQEVFTLGPDLDNRLHIRRGRFVSINRGDLIARGLFVKDGIPLPHINIKHIAFDSLHHITVEKYARLRVASEINIHLAR